MLYLLFSDYTGEVILSEKICRIDTPVLYPAKVVLTLSKYFEYLLTKLDTGLGTE